MVSDTSCTAPKPKADRSPLYDIAHSSKPTYNNSRGTQSLSANSLYQRVSPATQKADISQWLMSVIDAVITGKARQKRLNKSAATQTEKPFPHQKIFFKITSHFFIHTTWEVTVLLCLTNH